MEQVEQLSEELSIVGWYIQMFDHGINTKELMKEILEAKAEIKFLKESSTKTISALEAKLEKQKNNTKKHYDKLVYQQHKVVNPLIKEVQISE